MEEIDAILAGDSSVTADATVTLSATATAAGNSSQSDTPKAKYAAGTVAPGSASLASSPVVKYSAAMTAAGSAAVSETLGENVTAGMPGSSSLGAAGSYSVGVSPTGVSSVAASARVKYRATSVPAGNSFISANPALTSQPVLITASSSLIANARVKSASVASMAGNAVVSATPNYVQIQATAAFHGGSDLRADPLSLGEWGQDGYGNSPYGGAHPPYGLLSAEALTPTLVRVRYTAMFDATFPDLLALFNYSISPPITIHSISIESAQSVLLNTDQLTGSAYTVTIDDARGYFGQPLSPYLKSQSFLGVPSTPTFFAVATRKTRVRVVFTNVMLQNAALTNPLQYQLTDLNGTSISILSVEAEQTSDVRSTVLVLGGDLVDERRYQVTTLSGIMTETLSILNPDTSVFQWVENTLQTTIPVTDFSGEVQNGLYGIHGGLVFFSPALQTSAPNSIIQVEEVDVCTRAFDEYHFPQPLDPPVLTTYGLSNWALPPITTLNSDASLWAAFPRLVDAKFELTMPAPQPGGPDTLTTDHVPAPVDPICDITLSETWDPTYVSLLNVTSWRLFDNDIPYTAGAASIAAAAPGFFTLTGLAGMTALSVGGFLTLSGAGYAGNNGTFRISAFISAASVEISNPFGVAPDPNNGAITWTKPSAFILANNVAPIPPGNTTSRTYLEIFMHGSAQATETANAILASQATMSGSSTTTASGTVL